MSYQPNFDPDELRERVGLQKRYPFSVHQNLTSCDGVRILGQTHIDGRIEIDAGLKPAGAQRTYLHEVAHVIARNSKLHAAPGADGHNKYFATLLAVMYRRAGWFDHIGIYDFSDVENIRFNGDGALPPDDELVSRFAFIVYRSGLLAKKPWSIEEIAQHLFLRMLDEVAGREIAPECYQRPLSQWFLQLFGIRGKS